ncbi:unnamed protein product [Periconia digitata]|uniref:Uncharacterized protein n=1 Tax=Periconia digitata TaxID=1303443 RepID=A0A9W4UN75_9PLEO|nr:unnamed protein product [Periconia digitata]
MPFFNSKSPEVLPTTVEEDPKQSYDSHKTKTSTASSSHDTASTQKPTTARTPSTRFKEPSQKPSSTSTPNVKRNPSNVSTSRPIPKTSISSASNKDSNHQSSSAARPPLQRRRTTAQTRYIDMLLELDDVPKLHNFLASGFTWILLAGYIVFPATFNKLQNDERLDEKANNRLKAEALATARNIPLLYIAAFACGIGVVGSLWLWWKHRKNYVWVINRVFLPALMNSLAGLISTLVNVYTAQEGTFSVTARVTLVVTTACSAVTVLLFLMYNSIMLKWVKMRHERETKKFEKSEEGNGKEKEKGGEDGAGAIV